MRWDVELGVPNPTDVTRGVPNPTYEGPQPHRWDGTRGETWGGGVPSPTAGIGDKTEGIWGATGVFGVGGDPRVPPILTAMTHLGQRQMPLGISGRGGRRQKMW